MGNVKQSLLEYLGAKNPSIIRDACPSGGNTKSKKRTYLRPTQIGKWEDFDYHSLRSMYGGALGRALGLEVSCQEFSTIPQLPFCGIADEDSLEALLVKWNQSVVPEALSKGQECLYKHQSRKKIYMAKGGQACFRDSGKFYPDWAGIQASTGKIDGESDESKPKNLLPGDTKLSKKWSSQNIVVGPVQTVYTSKDWISPLEQVYTYCVKANARYGYVITDTELVVIRIRPNLEVDDSQPISDSQASWLESTSVEGDSPVQQSNSQEPSYPQQFDEGNDLVLSYNTQTTMTKNGRLEYQVVPWSNARTRDPRRSEELTVNLSLWWLHIMATVSSNIKEQYPPLKEVVQPTFFGDRNSYVALSEVSPRQRPKFAFRSRKRSRSTSASDGSNDGYPIIHETSQRETKRPRTDNEDSQNRRHTRSMNLSAD